MANKAVFIDEIADGLEVTAANKLAVKAGRNVTVDDSGVHVDLPAPTDLGPVEQRLTATEAKDVEQDGRIQALEQRNDIKLQNAVVEDTTLKLTTSDDVEIEVDLAKFLNVVPTAQDIYNELKEQIIRDVKAAIKGEVIQNLAGDTKGYLIIADQYIVGFFNVPR